MANGDVLGIKEIMAAIPHRFPMLLVDRVIIIDEAKKARGIKNVTANEDFFNGHFPGNPVMPGVLMIEAMAQTGGVFMMRKPELKGKSVLFVSINNVKFRRVVIPGDQLIMDIELTRWGGKICAMSGTAKVGEELAVECDLVCAIIDNPDTKK